MFSNLASFIFGSAAETGEPVQVPQEAAPAEDVDVVVDDHHQERAEDDDEWELVGEDSPQLTLGSLSEAHHHPAALGSAGSSPDPSMDSEESGDAPAEPPREGEGALTRTARRLAVPFGSAAASGATSLSEVRSIRAAQGLKAKESGKHLTSKALERRNKAVKHHHVGHSGRKSKAPTMALKASGSSRHLKQC